MISKELDNLVGVGSLKREPADQGEFDRLLESGRTRLTDASAENLSAESRFTLAYDAAHAFSLAALRWHGYRPDRTRFIVFQALQHTLGLQPSTWRILTKSHERRNDAEYRGVFVVDSQLLAELLETAHLVGRRVEVLGPVPKSGNQG